MTKELFVSTTPHETRVGLVEDDLLAEIYLERENEYTLAGSIYKGRVTRVLPGMQSAFVDIGLERDAFLYVSDFMELEEGDDVDEIPTNRPVTENTSRQGSEPSEDAQTGRIQTTGQDTGAEFAATGNAETASPSGENRGPSNGREQQDGDDRGGFRGRRRRRGRRGERMPESKFARPASDAPREAAPVERAERPERTERPARNDRSDRSDRSDYGPPPGYQPIVLPGESISKYSRLSQNQPAQRPSQALFSSQSSEPVPAAGTF